MTPIARTARRLVAVVAAAALVPALVAGAATATPQTRPDSHPHQGGPFPDRLELPDGFAPEGIAIGRRPVAYLGSLVDGDLYRLDLRTGRGEVFSEGPGTSSVGLKLDRRGRLWVAGGDGGGARVVDSDTGEVLATYDFDGGFVNDVVLTRRSAWFTDSSKARLYRVPLTRRLCGEGAVRTVPLTGDWQQVEGFNANGLVETPDRRALLVVQSATGFLFRVNRHTGAATRVDLGGELLTFGDGLLRSGRTLYAVRNRLNQVAVVRLDRRGRSGRLIRSITSPDFDVPTTVARFGRSLYLPNARFGVEDATEFEVIRVRR